MSTSDLNAAAPIVSVIIPTYNRASMLKYAIQSVLNQSYPHYEIIIVDDGSTDNTPSTVRLFKDERISFIKHEVVRGASAARNTALQICRGKYIAFIDDDDQWKPDKLKKQITAFQKASPEVGVVYTAFWKIKNNRQTYMPSSEIIKKQGNIQNTLLQENIVGTPAALVQKECFKKAGLFDERLPRLQDWELFIRFSKYYHFKFIDEPLLTAYCQKDGISNNQTALIKAMELILEKHFEEFQKNKKNLTQYYINISNLSAENREMNKSRAYLIKALKMCPSNIKFSLAALLTFLGPDFYNDTLLTYTKIKNTILHS